MVGLAAKNNRGSSIQDVEVHQVGSVREAVCMLVNMYIESGNIAPIPSVEDNGPREEVNTVPESPEQGVLLLARSPERQFRHIRLLGVARPDANPSSSFHVNSGGFLCFAVRAESWEFCG